MFYIALYCSCIQFKYFMYKGYNARWPLDFIHPFAESVLTRYCLSQTASPHPWNFPQIIDLEVYVKQRVFTGVCMCLVGPEFASIFLLLLENSQPSGIGARKVIQLICAIFCGSAILYRLLYLFDHPSFTRRVHRVLMFCVSFNYYIVVHICILCLFYDAYSL